MRLSFRTLQRGNAVRDALRRKEDAERLERAYPGAFGRADSAPEAHETSFILPPLRCKPRQARAAEDRSISDHWGT
ncbi:DUF1534 domain-containing protein [Pseudomonas syringae pv. pisi str. PP1]|nr:DUF1534 domain-containing protein [Pseudomonas syringae pv. pisi str. PP1]